MIDAVRAVDRRTAVFYEPQVLFNYGADTYVAPGEQRLGFSFHDYCLTADAGAGESGVQQACGQADDLVWSNAAAHVDASGDAPMLTEFGATDDRRP